MKKIYFSSGHLNERGTDVALYDYAYFNKHILKNESVILYREDRDQITLSKFQKEFECIPFRQDVQEINEKIKDADLYYSISIGTIKGEIPRPKNGTSALHCVFRSDSPRWEEYDIYASISNLVSKNRGAGRNHPVVPHMVNLPRVSYDLRETLNIPKEAILFGRYGGAEEFNYPGTWKAIETILHATDKYFLFMNTNKPSFSHPRLIFLDKTIDPKEKSAFINTCDAMIHSRVAGETFGLAIAEFSVHNKPIITNNNGIDMYHKEILRNKGFYYNDFKELFGILLNFVPQPEKDWDCYSRHFSPEKVIQRFKEVFIDQSYTNPFYEV